MDLNNRILVEILESLLDLVKLTTRIGQATALQSYQGVSDEGMENELEKEQRAALEGIGKFLKETQQTLNESVEDPKNLKQRDINKVLGFH
jgi:hypothetical protein